MTVLPHSIQTATDSVTRLFGRGTNVMLGTMRTTKSGDVLRISATIHVEADVTLSTTQYSACDVCARKPPSPETDLAALWFLLLYHDGNRLVFPDGENCDAERDRYPVSGWRAYDGHLRCPECQVAIDQAIKQATAKRRSGP